MNGLQKGLAVAGIHLVLVLGIAGKYAVDRATLPKAWAKALPFDPDLPIRGRYVRLRLEVQDKTPITHDGYVKLSTAGGQLYAEPAQGSGVWLFHTASGPSIPVVFFIPEHVTDPSRRAPGEELWAEVSVPAHGSPRPLRLAVKKDGVLKPLDLN